MIPAIDLLQLERARRMRWVLALRRVAYVAFIAGLVLLTLFVFAHT